ncbi:MAG: sulfoxide reductase heme-binding subunit YedZ [Anaerolineales bacterium]|nr:sulfoxide reductase heme-binding subunit YedZ [Anaerolineales bacterium]
MNKPGLLRLPILLHAVSLLPLILLVIDTLSGNLTANPIQELTLRTGKLGLIFLILSLSCTPISTLTGWIYVLKARRPLGLYAFFYICLHVMVFIGLDYIFDFNLILTEISEKRYVVAGISAFVLLIPLAITSTEGWMKRLGKKWKRLHRLVYLAAILVIVHFVWLVKSDIREPLIYGAVVFVLLFLRLPPVRKVISKVRRKHLAVYFSK